MSWQTLTVRIMAAVTGVVGATGVGLWVTLFRAIDHLSMAGTCVVRVGVPPVLAVVISVIGAILSRRQRRRWQLAAYFAAVVVVLLFATYCVLFLSWAVRVWPDQCICECS